MLKYSNIIDIQGMKLKVSTEQLTGPERVIKGVCIHNTNTIEVNLKNYKTQSEQYTAANINGNLKDAKVHYFVDEFEAWNSLSDSMEGAHSGDGRTMKVSNRGELINGNINTISIEGIGPQSYSGLVKLTAYLCDKYSFNPYKDIYFHRNFSEKNCPLYIQDHSKFIKDVSENLLLFTKTINSPHKVNTDFMVSLGITDGTRPTEPATREEVFTLLTRLYNKLK